MKYRTPYAMFTFFSNKVMADTGGEEGERKPNFNLFMRTTDFIDNHLRLFKYTTVYGLAGAGIIIILRRTYALRKFGHVRDVPRDFIKEHTRLRGHVVQISDQGRLLVDHAPIVSVEKFKGRRATDGKLPISLAGVELSTLAFPWLHEHILDKHVWFTLLRVQGKCVEGNRENLSKMPDSSKNAETKNQHSITQETLNSTPSEGSDSKENTELEAKYNPEDSPVATLREDRDVLCEASPEKTSLVSKDDIQEVLDCIVLYKKSFLRNANLNLELVRLGLATCANVPGLPDDREINKLVEGLTRSQKKAERKGLGIWSRPSLRERIQLYPAYLKYRIQSYIRETFTWKAKKKT